MHFCPAIIRRFLVPSARFPKWAQVPFEATGGTLASTDFAPILLGSFCEFTGCKTPDRNLCWKMRRIIFEWMQNSQKWWAGQCEEQRGWDFEQNHIITFCWDIGGKHFKGSHVVQDIKYAWRELLYLKMIYHFYLRLSRVKNIWVQCGWPGLQVHGP